MASLARPDFHELLESLRVEHEREVQALRSQLAAKLSGSTDASSAVARVPAPPEAPEKPDRLLEGIVPVPSATSATLLVDDVASITSSSSSEIEVHPPLAIPGRPTLDSSADPWSIVPTPASDGSFDGQPAQMGKEGKKQLRRVSFDSHCLDPLSAVPGSNAKKKRYRLQECWRKGNGVDMCKAIRRSGSGAQAASKIAQLSAEFDSPRSIDRLVGNPNSWRHFGCDLVGLALIVYDCLVVPLEVFQLEPNPFLLALNWLTTLFWSFDMVRAFFVGYHDRGDLVMKLDQIVWHYLQTWLGFDVLLVSCNWIALLLEVAARKAQARTFHSFKLLRILKMFGVMKAFEDRVESERVAILLMIAKQLGGIVLMCHGIACTWFAIGDATSRYGPSWVLEFVHERSFMYQYATAFHWALTQFTPASIDVQPLNVAERCFAIVTLLFALIMFSLFISGITSALMDLRKLSSAKSKQLWILRRYLIECGVPTEVSIRVQRYCSYAWDVRTRSVQEESVSALELLSTPLQAELRTAIFEPRLADHPLFVLINKLAPLTMQLLCTTAVSRVSVASGDVLFQSGQVADKMFFISGGSLIYERVPSETEDDDEDLRLNRLNSFLALPDVEAVEAGAWVGEAALWVEWAYLGSLHAQEECELVTLDASKFHDAVCSNRNTRAEAAFYARHFEQGINRLERSKVSDLFQSGLIEGLWFRLLSEYQVRRCGNRRGSRVSNSILFDSKVAAKVARMFKTSDSADFA
mmetsp:Transcript_61649/g.198598  ORF Transcript_61649/g.198598 Transcript_61649/m.198598 type:complete len:751 (-) Transcript_61649:276-2528(-)